MDLKTGEFYWQHVARHVDRYDPLGRDLTCDVAIIGGGVTGALCAYHLAGAGASIVVLDRRQIAQASTLASTGLLQYEIDTPLFKLIELVGPDHARRAYRVCVRALAEMRNLVDELDDGCALIPRPSLFLACEDDDLTDLRAEVAARSAIGIEVDLIEAPALRHRCGIDRPGGLWSREAMEVDPFRLTLALMRGAAGQGALIFSDTAVDKYEPEASGVTLHTDRGPNVRASRVVFATGYETPEFLDRDICRLRYAMASQPIDDLDRIWPQRCLIWESGDAYFYARTTPDNRAMIGGEDISSSDPAVRDAQIDPKSQELVNKFESLIPSLPPLKSEFRWAGTFAQTKDGLPYIGTTDQFPCGYFALGYGGNGITFSLIAAQIIRDLFAGRPNRDAELFRFGR